MNHKAIHAGGTRDGACVTETRRIAKENGVHIIAGFIEKGEGKPYNTMFAAGKTGDLLAVYHKNHLYAGSKEPLVYEPGKELASFELEGWKCALACCFDVRFPRMFEAYKRVGTELVFMGFNFYAGRNKPAIMDFLVKARAHENQFFVAATDRSGTDPTGRFTDQSVIINPYGENVISAANDIYSDVELKKEEIQILGKALPLAPSFKESYEL